MELLLVVLHLVEVVPLLVSDLLDHEHLVVKTLHCRGRRLRWWLVVLLQALCHVRVVNDLGLDCLEEVWVVLVLVLVADLVSVDSVM